MSCLNEIRFYLHHFEHQSLVGSLWTTSVFTFDAFWIGAELVLHFHLHWKAVCLSSHLLSQWPSREPACDPQLTGSTPSQTQTTTWTRAALWSNSLLSVFLPPIIYLLRRTVDKPRSRRDKDWTTDKNSL